MGREVAAVQVSELRGSVRFPIRLPVELHGEYETRPAETLNISAGGVLLVVAGQFDIGARIDFSIAMPAAVLGTPHDVSVNCVGRVVRCERNGESSSVAAVIDEYRINRN